MNQNNTSQPDQLYMDKALKDADELWQTIMKTTRETPDIRNWDDTKKIEYFYKNNKGFYNEFPIVCRYMITVGQYSSKAFSKYLKLKMLDVKNRPSPETREKNYVEDMWIRREAEYVKLLYKSYRKGHCTESQLKEVWKQAYESLKAEFSDFRKNYKQIEEKLKEEKIKNQQQLTKEAILRIAPKKEPTLQTVDTREDKGVIPPKQTEDIIRKQRLKEILLVELAKQKKDKVINEIRNSVKLIL